TLVAGSQGVDRSRALDVRWLRVHPESTLLDPVTHVRIALGQMPGQLAERSSTAVRAEVVLIRRQCPHEFQGALRLTIPRVQKHVEFAGGHDRPPDATEG